MNKRIKKPAPKPFAGKCFKCQRTVTQDDHCWGCREYVCEECNVGGLRVPWGGHNVDAHFKHYSDDGEELDDLSEDDDE